MLLLNCSVVAVWLFVAVLKIWAQGILAKLGPVKKLPKQGESVSYYSRMILRQTIFGIFPRCDLTVTNETLILALFVHVNPKLLNVVISE